MASPNRESRIKGSIFGVAVADALGGPAEFMPRGTFPKVTEYLHNGTFGVPPGTWTDDTSMTLCLAKALIDHKGIYVSQAATRNYIRWWKNGYLSATDYCFDIGAGTTTALRIWKKFFEKKDAAGIQEDDRRAHEECQPEIDQALKYERFCGNGSLMRVSPIGLVYSHDIGTALSVAARSSAVTHPYPTCAECCMIYTKLIVRAMNGATKEALAQEVADTAIVDEQLKGRLGGYTDITTWQDQDVDNIKSSGFVISTLEAALWGFFTTTSFQEGAIKVVNLGYDADTVAAVYGGLAGAYYGVEGIPGKWIKELQKNDVVEEIASGLVSLHQPK